MIITLNGEVNKEKFTLVCFAVISWLMLSCTSSPKALIYSDRARLYDTKAQIRTLNETNTVNIQIALLPFEAARLEVTGTLGVSVATVLVLPKQIKMALHLEKTYIEGPANQKTFYALFKQNISPRLLWKIIHDQNPTDANWVCKLNEASKPVACSSNDGSEAKWTYESPARRRIDIKNNTFEMSWIFKDQSQLPQFQNETFVLNRPEGYKEIFIKP